MNVSTIIGGVILGFVLLFSFLAILGGKPLFGFTVMLIGVIVAYKLKEYLQKKEREKQAK